MTSSNRDNPAISTYYQDFADLLGIFWQFHKERIESGNIQFAMTQRDGGKMEAFQPTEKFSRRYAVINQFAQAVDQTMESSWDQFLNGVGMYDGKHLFDDFPVPEEQQRFFDEYTANLAQRTSEGVVKYAEAVVFDGERTLENVGAGGMQSGSEATTQLVAIFGDEFNSSSAILLSKVKQDKVELGFKGIGLSLLKEIIYNNVQPPEYSLLDNSPQGLDRERLRELGLGSTLGCPASMRVSSEAKDFLESKDVRLTHPTMLEDFAGMTAREFRTTVRGWHEGLTWLEQTNYVTRENNKILRGEVLKNSRNERLGCPYGTEY